MDTLVTESQAGLLDLIETMQPYLFYSNTTDYRRVMRVDATVQKLREAVTSFRPLSGFAVALRGSFARGDPSPFSDADIVVISDINLDVCSMIDWFRSRVLEHEVSVSIYPPEPDDQSRRSLMFWQFIPHLLFVAGDFDMFSRFKLIAERELSQLPLTMLLKLYADEIKQREWSNPGSAHFSNLKRGAGGLIEYEFVVLLKLWQNLRQIPLTPAQQFHYHAVRKHYRYMTLLKEYLCWTYNTRVETYRTGPLPVALSPTYWFFGSNIAERIAIECHGHATQFIALVPH
jgi:predicted nucleotidyltransferase